MAKLSTQELRQYILDRVITEPVSGCWAWQGPPKDSGYGQAWKDGRPQYAHRLAYQAFVGPIPEGMHVCHTCDNRLCCNPSHLWTGTNADNTRDRNLKGRQAHGGSHGMVKLTEADAREIKRLLSEGSSPQNVIAKRFGVSPRAVRHIKRGTTWAYLA